MHGDNPTAFHGLHRLEGSGHWCRRMLGAAATVEEPGAAWPLQAKPERFFSFPGGGRCWGEAAEEVGPSGGHPGRGAPSASSGAAGAGRWGRGLTAPGADSREATLPGAIGQGVPAVRHRQRGRGRVLRRLQPWRAQGAWGPGGARGLPQSVVADDQAEVLLHEALSPRAVGRGGPPEAALQTLGEVPPSTGVADRQPPAERRAAEESYRQGVRRSLTV